MCYILYMNKDVIYVEPEDDITDIITKIENAKEKIVAIVPPKKASVFRSIVNIKLINKAGLSADKKIVLVTSDASVIKLAAVAKLPVTKSLQSAPAVPEIEGEVSTTAREELSETDDGAVKSEETTEPEAEKANDDTDKEADSDEEKTSDDKEDGEETGEKSAKDSDKDSDKDGKNGKDGKKLVKDKAEKAAKSTKNWFVKHKVPLIIGGVSLVVLILVGVWMFVLAPAVSITVSIRTEEKPFSENVSFVNTLQEEVASEGKFYIEEKKLEDKQEKSFEATGKKNIGEKAKGELIISAAFRSKGSTSVEAGDVFSNGSYSYTVDESVTLGWDGASAAGCDNRNASATDFLRDGCIVSKTINVTAVEPGEKYNLTATAANWRSDAGFGAYSTNDFTGGSDKIITVVSQEDIDKVVGELSSSNTQGGRDKLIESLDGKQLIPIDSSFSRKVGEPVSSPALGEEVKEGQRAKLSITTTDSIYVIDKTKVEEFIAVKAKLSENYKIYEINQPYIDNFIKNDAGATGKLKAESISSGPKVTENDVVEMAKGKGLGTAQHELSSINGVSKITIDPSYPWVTAVPGNPDKIMVTIKIAGSGE